MGSCRWCRVTIVGSDGEELATAVLSGPGAADLLAVDAVGRLAVAARRVDATARVSEVSAELAHLLELAALGVEVEGQSEEGEDALEVVEGQEEAQPGDLAR